MATSIGRIGSARQRFCAIRIHVHSATRATIRAHAVNSSVSSVRVDLRVSARRLFTTLPKTTVLSCTTYPSLQAQARSAQSGFALRSSLRVDVQRFSTEAAPAEPPTPTLPEPFLVKHAGPLLLTPLAILAVIVAFLLLVPLFSEREYVTLVSQTFERGACVSADSTNVPITTLAPYAESIESIIRSNDGPNFRRTFWVLSASDAAELSSLLRSLCTAHPTGVVYLKITNTTTFARELGHTFSFVFQDEDSGTYSTIRRVFTDAYGTAEPLYSMKNFFSVLKKGAVAFKGSTGRVPVFVIDGFDQLHADEKSLAYVQRLANDTAEAGSMIVVFAASDPRVITQLKGPFSWSCIQLLSDSRFIYNI